MPMDLQSLFLLILRCSIVLFVLSFSLQASVSDALFLPAHPKKFLSTFAAMDVVMPATAIAFALTLPLAAAVKVTLFALSVSPVPPFLPHKQLRAGGSHAYAIG